MEKNRICVGLIIVILFRFFFCISLHPKGKLLAETIPYYDGFNKKIGNVTMDIAR